MRLDKSKSRLLCYLIVAGSLIFALYEGYVAARYYFEGKKADGIVLREDGLTYGQFSAKRPEFQFTVGDGFKCKATGFMDFTSSFPAGKEVEVLYHKDALDEARIAAPLQLFFKSFAALALGLLALALALMGIPLSTGLINMVLKGSSRGTYIPNRAPNSSGTRRKSSKSSSSTRRKSTSGLPF